MRTRSEMLAFLMGAPDATLAELRTEFGAQVEPLFQDLVDLGLALRIVRGFKVIHRATAWEPDRRAA